MMIAFIRLFLTIICIPALIGKLSRLLFLCSRETSKFSYFLFCSRNLSPASQDHSSQSVGSLRSTQLQRPTSPSPSLASEQPKDPAELAERHKIEEEERKRRIQLYVFVSRCVSYPFNSKQPNDMTKRQQKITKQNLDTITNRFQAFMKGETQIMADEAFQNAVQSYHDVFLKSDRVQKMVASGACSQHDFREVFRNNIEKRVRSLPEIDGLSKETVLTSWMAKFDCILKGSGEFNAPSHDFPCNYFKLPASQATTNTSDQHVCSHSTAKAS